MKRTETNSPQSEPNNLLHTKRKYKWAPDSEQEFQKAIGN